MGRGPARCRYSRRMEQRGLRDHRLRGGAVFKPTVTQAANEAARRAAVTQDLASPPGVDERELAAEAAINDFEA